MLLLSFRYRVSDGHIVRSPAVEDFDCIHDFAPYFHNGFGGIRLMPFAETPNPGDEYQMVCVCTTHACGFIQRLECMSLCGCTCVHLFNVMWWHLCAREKHKRNPCIH